MWIILSNHLVRHLVGSQIRMKSQLIFFLLAFLFATPLRLALSQRHHNSGRRIVNGTPTRIELVPYHVHFQIHDDSDIIFCGGAILSHFWVLTAGHCLINYDASLKSEVWVGTHMSPLFSREGTPFKVDLAVVHPEYLLEKFKRIALRDIALLRLAQALKYSEKVLPINLPMKNEEKKYSKAYIMGFGSYFGELKSKVLRRAQIDVKEDSRCINTVRKMFPSLFKRSDLICCLIKEHEACSGDSGSPLVAVRSDGSPVVIGISSSGNNQPCGQSTADPLYLLFSRVSTYRRWIKRTMRQYGKRFASSDRKRSNSTNFGV